jgi:hypothetical protein
MTVIKNHDEKRHSMCEYLGLDIFCMFGIPGFRQLICSDDGGLHPK